MKILNKNQCQRFIDLATARLKKYIEDNHLKGITTGISGGIDSAIVGVLGKKSNIGLKYFFLDCESEPGDYQKARELAERFEFPLEKIDLTAWYNNCPLLKQIPKSHEKAAIAKGNIKARLRMISLYQQALLNKYICLDTGDLSEKMVGFWTRHGDEGDVKIIQKVTKTELYDLGEFLNIPDSILKSKPGDGLNVTKNNQAIDQIGLDYIYVEYIISSFMSAGFNCDGEMNQLNKPKFLVLEQELANKLNKPLRKIHNVLERSIKTAYKRKYGDKAVHLLPKRTEFDFAEFGTKEFNRIYLNAIINYYDGHNFD